MKKVFGYLKDYYIFLNKRVFVLSALFVSLLIFINYYYGLNKNIVLLNEGQQFFSWYFVFLAAFAFPYSLVVFFKKNYGLIHARFIALLLIAPALFAWKMAYQPNFHFTHHPITNDFWNQVAYWPFKLMVMTATLLIIWKVFDQEQTFYGTGTKYFEARPYWVMLLIMVPLVALAATQPDFLRVYPKFQHVYYLSQPQSSGWHQLLFELSYGSDFVSIELFFRGFLILAFTRWAGKDTILPMALFYCTIHFGKPLGECISSFFGGVILGVITFHTKSIWGGFMVHLGIAWMMELAGYLAKHTHIP